MVIKMNLTKVRIDTIPAILWGGAGDKIIIAAHGSHSSKIDDCMWVLAEEAVKKGYQVLTFDFPQHGERVYETERLMPNECVRELEAMYSYAKNCAKSVSVFGCSMGAYFQLLAYADFAIDRAWFLSPVTDMERIIRNLMAYCHVSEEEFWERVTVENDIETLYYPYYTYVKSHPITKWGHETYILRGERDMLCEYEAVRQFADTFQCELTQQKEGEHWFHTTAQLEFFRAWLRERL